MSDDERKELKIGAVQFKPVAGDIEENLIRHTKFIELAADEGLELVYFPELSITGYEPQLAKSLALETSNTAFDIFQHLSNIHNITIGVGAPLSLNGDIQIGMVWFEPNKARSSYKKQLLHPDEARYFIAGNKQTIIQTRNYHIAPAICYESLQPSHAEAAANLGANVYAASVAKHSGGITKAMQHYPEAAKKHSMCVVMANCVGPCDDFIGEGSSAAWDTNGKLLAKMESDTEGVLILDVKKETAIIRVI